MDFVKCMSMLDSFREGRKLSAVDQVYICKDIIVTFES